MAVDGYLLRILADAYEDFARRVAAGTELVGATKEEQARNYILTQAPRSFRLAQIVDALPDISQATIRNALDDSSRGALSRSGADAARAGRARTSRRAARRSAGLDSPRADRVAADGRGRRGAARARARRARRRARCSCVEAMKMQHEVVAPEAGVVRELAVAVGEQVAEGAALLRVEAATATARARRPTPSGMDGCDDDPRRPRRGRSSADAARSTTPPPERGREAPRDAGSAPRARTSPTCATPAVRRVRRAGRSPRSARAAAREELIERTPGRRHGGRHRHASTARADARCACWPTTTRCSPARRAMRNHRRPTACSSWPSAAGCRSCCSPRAAAGGPGDTDMPDRRRPRRADASTPSRGCRGLVPRVGIVVRPLLRRQRRAARLLRRHDRDRRTRNIGMGGPAMIEGGGLGSFTPEEVGPIDVQAPQRRDRRAWSTTRPRRWRVAQALPRATSRARGAELALRRPARCCARVVPENRLRVYDVRARASTPLADDGLGAASCAAASARGIVTALRAASRAGRSA